MSTTADDSPAAGTQHAGLQDLFSYPLTSALQDRRTRRVAQGVSLKHGAQPYESPNAAVAADAAGGGDPDRLDQRHRRGHARRADQEARRLARARDDVPRGRRPRRLQRRQRPGDVVLHDQRRGRVADRAPARRRRRSSCSREIPPRWEDRTEDDWLSFANAVKRKVYDGRFAIPEKQWPYFLGWNGQMSNAPGTTQLPAGGRQHAPVHQRAADPAVASRTARCRCSSTTGSRSGRRTRWSGRRGRRRSSASSTRSRTSRSAASSAPAAASRRSTRRRRWARSRPCAPTTRRTSCSRT